jgi:excisionase family DNA binding protein
VKYSNNLMGQSATLTIAAEGFDMDEPLIGAREVARRLGMGRTTVLLFAREGRIPSVRVSPRIIRFAWAEVIRALNWPVEQGVGGSQ